MDNFEARMEALRAAEKSAFNSVVRQIAEHHIDSLQSSIERQRAQRKSELAQLLVESANRELHRFKAASGSDGLERESYQFGARVATQLVPEDLPLLKELLQQYSEGQ